MMPVVHFWSPHEARLARIAVEMRSVARRMGASPPDVFAVCLRLARDVLRRQPPEVAQQWIEALHEAEEEECAVGHCHINFA